MKMLKSGILCVVISLMFVISSCKSDIAEQSVFNVNNTITENSISSPALFVKDNCISLLNPPLKEFEDIVTFPESSKITFSKPCIYRANAIYFGITQKTITQNLFSIWKFEKSSGILEKLYTIENSNYQLKNIDSEEAYISLWDTSSKKVLWYDCSRRELIDLKLNEDEMEQGIEQESFFTNQTASVICCNRITNKETNSVYKYYKVDITDINKASFIGTGKRHKLSNDGSLFVFESSENSELTLYDIETKKTSSFSFEEQNIYWDFWGDKSIFVIVNDHNNLFKSLHRLSINLGDNIVELPLEMENNIRKRFSCSLGNSIYLYNWTNEKYELFIVDEMENWNSAVLLEKPNYSTENTFAQTVISQKKYTNPFNSELSEGNIFCNQIENNSGEPKSDLRLFAYNEATKRPLVLSMHDYVSPEECSYYDRHAQLKTFSDGGEGVVGSFNRFYTEYYWSFFEDDTESKTWLYYFSPSKQKIIILDSFVVKKDEDISFHPVSLSNQLDKVLLRKTSIKNDANEELKLSLEYVFYDINKTSDNKIEIDYDYETLSFMFWID